MADSVLFEVDASQILAKLHLAGLQTFKTNDKAKEFIVNTGIKNDNPDAKPDNPGNVTFDLKNSSGEYEVGFVTEIQYKKTFKFEDDFDINNGISQLEKIISSKSDSKLDDKIDEKTEKEKTELQNRIREILSLDDNDFPLNDLENINTLKDEKATELSNSSIDGYEDAVNAKMPIALNMLNAYMKVFAGADNVKTINEDNIATIIISSNTKDSNDSSLVKMFEIVPISDAEQAKLTAQFRAIYQKNPKLDKPNCTQKVCFKIKYDLNVDK